RRPDRLRGGPRPRAGARLRRPAAGGRVPEHDAAGAGGVRAGGRPPAQPRQGGALHRHHLPADARAAAGGGGAGRQGAGAGGGRRGAVEQPPAAGGAGPGPGPAGRPRAHRGRPRPGVAGALQGGRPDGGHLDARRGDRGGVPSVEGLCRGEKMSIRPVPRALRVAPRLDEALRPGPVVPRHALLINPFYAKDAHASFGKHVLTPTLALTSLAGATPPGWAVRYWDENLLQGHPPVEPFPQVVGLTVHLTFARPAYELAACDRARGALVAMGGLHGLSCPH